MELDTVNTVVGKQDIYSLKNFKTLQTLQGLFYFVKQVEKLMNILEFKNVSFSYDDKNIISNLSFAIDRPKSVSIVGVSGCGKTTVFRLILSLLKSTSGEILYKEQDISTLTAYAGYMPQKDLLFPWKNIRDNLSVPMDIKGLKKSEKEERIDEILSHMNLSEVKYKFPHELSGGMRQRISFARTILTGSDLLLFDEPLSALDYITRISMQKWLSDTLCSYQNKTAVFITHDIDEAIFLSDEILVVKNTPITSFEKISVSLPKPRTREMLNQRDILDMKNHILSLLAVKI